jgi:regulatory protein
MLERFGFPIFQDPMTRKPADYSRDADAETCKALLKKAAAMLARRSYSRGDLRNKLLAKEAAPRVEAILDRLEQLNLLNDAEYAYNFALYRIERESWGAAKVTEALQRRHVDQETIENALRRVQSELGVETVAVEYMQKYCGKDWPPADPKQVQKLMVHLRRRGFGEDAIDRALKEILSGPLYKRSEIGE